MALDATVGGPAANSYNTVVETTAILTERLHAEAWTTAVVADQEAALIMATRALDESVRWYGTPTTPTQALAWPQTGQVDCFGRPVPTTIIPDVIKQATAEEALALLRDQSEATSVVSAYWGTGLEEIAMDDMRLRFASGGARAAMHSPRTMLPTDVRQMLRCYGTVAGDSVLWLLRT